jgi:hypothetical protein
MNLTDMIATGNRTVQLDLTERSIFSLEPRRKKPTQIDLSFVTSLDNGSQYFS